MKTQLIRLGLLTCLCAFAPTAFSMDEREDWEEHEEHEHYEHEEEWEMEEVIEEAMTLLRKLEPGLVPVVEKMDEEEFAGHAWELVESWEECEELYEEYPPAGELCEKIIRNELRIHLLAHQIRSGDKGKAEELREVLSTGFDLRQEESKMEVAYLEKELAEIKQRWQRRAGLKDKIIEKRFRSETGADEDLEW